VISNNYIFFTRAIALISKGFKLIPTQENKKKLTEKKLQVHKKISNTFIENAINNSNTSALKIIYYLASILKDFNYKEEFNTLNIDLKDMLKYTELRASDIRNNIKTNKHYFYKRRGKHRTRNKFTS